LIENVVLLDEEVNMLRRKVLFLLVLLIVIFLLTGCLPGDGKNTVENPAGFFWGIWHGWLAPVSIIIGFFNRTIRVYEVFNRGWSYDVGFYMAVISGFRGIGFFRRKKKQD